MSAKASVRAATEPVGFGDVLEQLTAAHTDLQERFGPLLGLGGVEPPAEAVTFAASQNALAVEQDAEPDVQRRLNLMLERNAREHEQIGRLASFIAGYELTHGDPDNAPAMAELGGSHFDLAAQVRHNLATHGGVAVNQNAHPASASGDMFRFMDADLAAQAAERLKSQQPGLGGSGIES